MRTITFSRYACYVNCETGECSIVISVGRPFSSSVCLSLPPCLSFAKAWGKGETQLPARMYASPVVGANEGKSQKEAGCESQGWAWKGVKSKSAHKSGQPTQTKDQANIPPCSWCTIGCGVFIGRVRDTTRKHLHCTTAS